MPDLAWVNGKISDLYEAKVPFLDHGYFFGYGVYEALKVYQGIPFAVEEHLDRLERSLTEIKIKPEQSRAEITDLIHELIRESELQEALFYLQITRGVGPRMPSVLANPRPLLSMFVSYLPPVPETLRKNGAKALLLQDDRWAHPHIKTLNLLPNIIAKVKADEKGAMEAILYNDKNLITEAASSNVFIVEGDSVITPPADGKILGGVSRMIVLRIMRNNNIKYREDYVTVEQLKKADEVFITNTGAEVLAITDLEGQRIGKGVPGPITHKLYDLFIKEVDKFLYDRKENTCK